MFPDSRDKLSFVLMFGINIATSTGFEKTVKNKANFNYRPQGGKTIDNIQCLFFIF